MGGCDVRRIYFVFLHRAACRETTGCRCRIGGRLSCVAFRGCAERKIRMRGVLPVRILCTGCCCVARPKKRGGAADERSDGERTGGGLKIAGLLHGGACGVGRSRYEPLQGRRSQCLRGRCGGVSDTVRNSSSVFPVWRHAGGRAGESTLKE